MSARIFPGRRVEWNLAGMMARTDDSVSVFRRRSTELGCTSNHTTADCGAQRGDCQSGVRLRVEADFLSADALAKAVSRIIATGHRDSWSNRLMNAPTMLTPQTVLLIGALSLTAGWLVWTSTSSNQNQDASAARQQSGPRPLGSAANVAPLTRQLRERLNTPPPRTPLVGRNPFVFSTRRPATIIRQTGESLPPSEAPFPLSFTPPPPQFKLSGIASSHEGGATVLTAMVNDNGTLAFVKSGDKLSNGFSVVRVDDTGIVIVDAAGVTQTLRLP